MAEPTKPSAAKSTGSAKTVFNWEKLTREAWAYNVEYFMMLLSLAVLTLANIVLFNSFINYLFDVPTNPLFGTSYTNSLFFIALALVSAPAFSILVRRVHGSEARYPEVFQNRRRKGASYLFLVIAFVVTLIFSAIFISTVLRELLNIGTGLTDGSAFWREFIKLLFTIGLLKAVFLAVYMGASPIAKHQPRPFRLRYAAGFALLAAFLVILQLLWPIREQRDEFVDIQIEGDMTTIWSAIEDHAAETGRLPADLSELNLSASVLDRADRYDYEYNLQSSANYQLCAVFTTDTSDEPPAELSTLDLFDPNAFTQSLTDFSRHSSGRQCFDLASTSAFSSFGSDDFLDGFLDDSTGLTPDQL